MKEQTIAKQLNVKEFPFTVKDKNGNEIYREDNIGYWYKQEFDSNDNLIYFETNEGSWYKQEYDINGKVIYFEDNIGYWFKREYNTNGNEIYYENSGGYIKDDRTKQKEYTMDEIAKSLGIDVSQLKIKK